MSDRQPPKLAGWQIAAAWIGAGIFALSLAVGSGETLQRLDDQQTSIAAVQSEVGALGRQMQRVGQDVAEIRGALGVRDEARNSQE